MQEQENRSMLWIGICAVVVVILIIAFLVSRNNAATPDTSGDTPTPVGNSQVSVGETFDLAAQNDSTQNGTVRLIEVGDQVQVTITLSNFSEESEPAHIHAGTCPTPGAVEFPLTNVVEGTSVTLLDTTLAELKAMGPLAVNVHKSATESSVYVSCGNLAF